MSVRNLSQRSSPPRQATSGSSPAILARFSPTAPRRSWPISVTATLAPALDGVHAVFLLTDGLHIAAHNQRFVAAARRAGVERIVKQSARGVGHGGTDPITTLHRAAEEAIRDSGIGWTFLRPTGFMSNALNWAGMIAADQVVHAAVRRWPGRGRRPGGHRSRRRGLPHPGRPQPPGLRAHRPRTAQPP